MEFLRIFIWIFLISHPIHCNLHICDITECQCTEKSITCRDKDPQWFHVEENENILYLDYRYCAIELIIPNYLKKFKNLKEIDVRYQSVHFDCLSIPEHVNINFLSECIPTHTESPRLSSPPQTSSFSSLHDFFKTLETTQKTVGSFIDDTTSKSYTVDSQNVDLSSNAQDTYSPSRTSISTITDNIPITTKTEAPSFLTDSTSSQIDTTLTSENAISFTSTNLTNFPPIFTSVSSVNKQSHLYQVNSDKIAWISLTVILTLLLMTVTIFITILIFLKKRRLARQLRRQRFSNEIYTGDNTDFISIHQMMTDREQENAGMSVNIANDNEEEDDFEV